MESQLTCGVCGSPLTNALCPRCLLDVGLSPEPDETPAQLDVVPPLARLGDYELLEEIGRGGMGVVYRARQVSLNRTVVLKLLPFGGLGGVDGTLRLRAEAVAAGSLRHPNIVAIHEVGLHQGQHFLAMDFVPGPSLARELRDGPLLPKRAATLLRKIALAVRHAHDRGIIHRDLKPSNILLDPTDDEPRVTDFGLAKNLHSDTQLTLTGQTLGSPNYIPPEQIRGRATVPPAGFGAAPTPSRGGDPNRASDERPDAAHDSRSLPKAKVSFASDVYALGAILYHALTGRPPFIGDDIAAVLQQVIAEEPLAPRRLNPSVPADLETICLKCLEKEPPCRYSTAQEFADELGRWLNGEPIRARAANPAEKVWRWCRRKPALAAAYALVLVLFLLLAFGGPIAAYRIDQARKAETAERQRAETEASARRVQLYAHEVNLANEALRDVNLIGARQLLARQRPGPGETNDLRGFEWRYVYGQCRNQERAALGPFSNVVTAVRFISHSDRMAVADSDGNAWLWDWRAGRQIAAYPARANFRDYWHVSERRSLAVSLDGKTLALAAGNDVSLVDLNSGQSRSELRGHTGAVRYLEFSPNGRTLASGSADGTARLWDFSVDPPMPLAVLNVGYGVSCAAFSADGSLLALAGSAFDVKLWDVSNVHAPRELPPLKGHITSVYGLAFSPVGRVFATAGAEIILWHLGENGETTSERRLVRGRGGLGVINFVIFSRDGQTLISAGSDRNITLWDLADKREPVRLMGHEGEIYFVAQAPHGGLLASACYDRSVKLWDISAPWPAPPRMSYSNFVKSVAFSPDSKLVASMAYKSDTEMKLWDAASEQLVAARDVIPGGEGNCLVFSPDGQMIAADGGGKIRLRRVPSLIEITNFPGRLSAFSSTGEELIYAHNGSIRRRNLGTHAEQTLSTGWTAIGLIVPLPRDVGMAVVGGENSKQVRLWRAEAPDQPIELGRHADTVHALACSPDGHWLASASWDGTSRIWNLTNLSEPARILASHKGAVWTVAFSPDGRTLATGGDDYTIKLWNVASWQEAATLRGHTHLVSALAFSPDGRNLASCSGDGTVRLWRAPTLEEIAAREKETKK